MPYHQTLFSSKRANWNIIIHDLVDKMDCLDQAVMWADEAWGHLENYQPVHRDDILANVDKFFIATYADQMIGMFSLRPRNHFDLRTVLLELTYVYIDERVRNLGMGSEMLRQIKSLAQEKFRATDVILETEKPLLNKFYERSVNAEFICERKSIDCTNNTEVSVLRIGL